MRLSLIVFVDSDCRLCNGFVALAHRRKQEGIQFRFIDLRSKMADELFDKHCPIRPDRSAIAVLDNGQVAFGAVAVIRVLAELHPPWPFCARVLAFVPPEWTLGLYRLIASNRYRILGRTEACALIETELTDPPNAKA